MVLSHRSFGSAFMCESGPVGARLVCACQLCLTWRRLGEEVHLGHDNKVFEDKALTLLRGAFEELVDFREVHRLSLWQPLAEGSRNSGERRGSPKRTPERGSGGEPPKSKRSEGASEPRGSRKDSSEDRKVAKKASKDSKVKKRRSRSRRRVRSKESSSSPRPLPSSLRVRRAGLEVEELGHPISPKAKSVKEELSEPEKNEEPTRSGEGVEAPAGRGEREERKAGPERKPGPRVPSGANSIKPQKAPSSAAPAKPTAPTSRSESPPPGRWTLDVRPAEPRFPPRSFRPPEPNGPPPGWRGKGGPKSKGTTRRERQADILRFGPDPQRKAAREAKRRGW